VKVWLVEDCPPYEAGHLFGVCATEELANELAARQQYQDWIAVYSEDVLTELPPREPVKQLYQVIP
jgi:hypothetical protein